MAHDLPENLVVGETEFLSLRRRGSEVTEAPLSSMLQGAMERRAWLAAESKCIYLKQLNLPEEDLEI